VWLWGLLLLLLDGLISCGVPGIEVAVRLLCRYVCPRLLLYCLIAYDVLPGLLWQYLLLLLLLLLLSGRVTSGVLGGYITSGSCCMVETKCLQKMVKLQLLLCRQAAVRRVQKKLHCLVETTSSLQSP
jgi:hypothetical protein